MIYIRPMESAAPKDRSLEGAGSGADWTKRLPLALLAVGMVLSVWLELSLNSKLSLQADEWVPLLNRPGWGVAQIFDAYNGHPTMIPMVIYKAVQELFGMDSARPVQILLAGTLVVTNLLLFIYLRRRVGDWAALIGTVMILFLGAAFEILIFPFTINFTGAIAAGIGALVALDRDDRKGDLTAAALLVVGVFFSLLIVPFIAAAAVEWWLNPRDRKDRAFVPAISIVLLALWWLIWGRGSEGGLEFSTITALPGNCFDILGAGFTSLFGLATGNGSEQEQPNLIWGQLMTLIAAGLAWWRIRILGRPPRDFLIVVSGLVTYLVMLGLSITPPDQFEEPIRRPTFPRFQFVTAIFLLMIASTLLRDVLIRPLFLVAAAVIAAFSIQGGISLMVEQVRDRWEPASMYVRTYLTGIELAGSAAKADAPINLLAVEVDVGGYQETANRFGSPALQRSEINGLDAFELGWIDKGLIDASAPGLDATPPADRRATCLQLKPGQTFRADPGRYRVENGTESEVTVLLAVSAQLPGPVSGPCFRTQLPA